MKTQTDIENILNKFRYNGIENELVEFKEAKHQFDFDKIGKYFSACAMKPTLKVSVRLG